MGRAKKATPPAKPKACSKRKATSDNPTQVYRRLGRGPRSTADQMDEATRERLEPWLGVLNKHRILPERGITLGTRVDEEGNLDYYRLRKCMRPLYDVVAEHGWVKFIEQPPSYCPALVREFYAGVCESNTTVVTLRGRPVDYSPAAINALFELMDYSDNEDDLLQMERDVDQIPFRYIFDILTQGAGAVRQRPTSKTMTITSDNIPADLTAWQHFVCARIYPGNNTSEVTQPRFLLLFNLIAGKKINIGRIISKQIFDVGQ